MKRGLASLCAVASLTLVAACGDDDSGASPSATLEPAPTTSSTTSTTVLTVEQEVEAAYLLSWEVFARAALELDPTGLDDVYAGRALEVAANNIDRLVRDGTPARFEVEHDYEIEVDVAAETAQVRDTYVNHSVLLHPETLEPTEPDPNEILTEIYVMRRVEGTWKVVEFSRL